MINKPTKLIVLTIILITVIAFLPHVYGADPPLQGGKTLTEKKSDLRRIAYAIRDLSRMIAKYKNNYQEIEDPKSKIEYKEFIDHVETGIQEYRSVFKMLVGMEYTNYKDFVKWWEENENYLYWSKDKQMLIVDEEAKKEKRALHELNPEIEIKAEMYWNYYAKGLITKTIKDDGVYLFSYIELRGIIRVKKSALEDRNQKQKAFVESVGSILAQWLFYPNSKEAKVLLKIITEEKFDDYESWYAWLNKNKDNLVLNKDGTKLVVKE